MRSKSIRIWLVLSLSANVALIAGWTLAGPLLLHGGADWSGAALGDRGVREEVIDELVAEAGGIWDSHPDPDVGRTLQPRLSRAGDGKRQGESNRFGIREREYELPKPPGVVRIVLLGDSLVEAIAVPMEERCGRLLEEMIRARTPVEDRTVEALHIGLRSWNILAECEFLRRQLGLLDPDLVVHVTTTNDLDDMAGVRGFGAMADFDPRHRRRANARLTLTHSSRALQAPSVNPLLLGLDHVSRTRYGECAEAIRRLCAGIEQGGGSYRNVLRWPPYEAVVREHLFPRLTRDHLVMLAPEFLSDPGTWVSETDHHWNAEGQRALARLLYGLIVRDDLLPVLRLPEWELAEEAVDSLRVPTEFASSPTSVEAARRKIASTLETSPLTPRSGNQIYAGIDGEGLVLPYAAFVLGNAAPGRLSLRGESLGRSELEGAVVQVYVEEFLVGTISIPGTGPIEVAFDLPEVLADREVVSVELVASDYAYAGPNARQCVVFRLHGARIGEP